MTAQLQPDRKPSSRVSAGDFAPAAAILILTLAASAAMVARGLVYDGTSLTILFVICGTFAATGLAIRIADPAARIAMGAETIALVVALNLLSMLTASAFAVSHRPLIDPMLDGIDRFIMPWTSWRAAVDLAVRTPGAMALLSQVYASLTWQPLLLVGAAIVARDNRILPRFNAAWAIGLLLCILPFYWLPALGPYPWFGLDQAAVPGHAVALPFKSGPLLESLRSGAVGTIGIHQLSGLVFCPSFHACGAVILLELSRSALFALADGPAQRGNGRIHRADRRTLFHRCHRRFRGRRIGDCGGESPVRNRTAAPGLAAD